MFKKRTCTIGHFILFCIFNCDTNQFFHEFIPQTNWIQFWHLTDHFPQENISKGKMISSLMEQSNLVRDPILVIDNSENSLSLAICENYRKLEKSIIVLYPES